MKGLNEFIKRALTWLLILFCFGGSYIHSPLLFIFLLIFIFAVILLREWPFLLPVQLGTVSGVLVTLLYPIGPMVATLLLHFIYLPVDFFLPLLPFCIAWTADTFGYLVGKLAGKHKICPSISPGKSWEGLVGSVVGVFLMLILFMPAIKTLPFTRMTHSYFYLAGLALLGSIISFLGGTLVSIFKRRANLKDTGSVLPGHGGFLDRFDSVFAAVLFVWICIGCRSFLP